MSPLIVIGMHRSGTSMLSRLLRKLGVFMGAELNHHDESLFFFSLNEYLFQLAHAAWDFPYPMRFLFRALNRDQHLKSSIISLLVSMLTSEQSVQHWGTKPEEVSDLESLLEKISGPWGWKDPRNSFTLPIWSEIFRAPKVIHIYRNGVDVSRSLLTREMKRENRLKNTFFSCRCMDLTEAFALWAEYVQMCLTLTESMQEGQVCTLCYEALLLDPITSIRDLSAFFSLRLSEAETANLAMEIRSERAFAFLDNPQLTSFYNICRKDPLMERLGYADLKAMQNGEVPRRIGETRLSSIH